MSERENFSFQDKTASEDRTQILFSWELVKYLRGENRKRAKGYLSSRDGFLCTFCGKNADLESLDVDHANENNEDNHRWNLRLMHHSCNSHWSNVLYHKKARLLHSPAPSEPKIEREKTGAKQTSARLQWIHTKEYSAEEGEKAEIMRARWNQYVEDTKIGTRHLFSFFAERAVGQCKLGSSETYARYLREDVAEGLFDRFRDDGRLWVTKVKDREHES